MNKVCVLLITLLTTSWTVVAKKTVLVIDPSEKEKKELQAKAIQDAYSFIFYDFENKSDEYGNEDLQQALSDIKKRYASKKLNGVFSSRDYLGNILSSLVAQELRLIGPRPTTVLTFQHKYLSCVAQRRFVPEATPQFGLIDPNKLEHSIKNAPLTFPLFVKPVKSYFSFGAMKITSCKELKKHSPDLLPPEPFRKPLDDMLRKEGILDSSYLLAQEILEGKQVTIEGFVKNGNVNILGIVDSIMYPGTISFERFEYPSSLAKNVQKRISTIAENLMKGTGFDNSFFNIEMMYNPTANTIKIIEINPRGVAQFADLYQKVDGISSYEIMLALASNSPIPVVNTGGGKYTIAASFTLRTWRDGTVTKSPSRKELKRTLKVFPDARLQIHVTQGQKLSDKLQDGKSYLYQVINLGGINKPDLLASFEKCKTMLPFKIDFE